MTMIWQQVEKAGEKLTQCLRLHTPIPEVERAVLGELDALADVKALISGCNRRVIGGWNTIQTSGSGRYIVVLNPVDGHVNYLMKSPLFGASVTAFDSVTGQNLSIVYDGLTDESLRLESGNSPFVVDRRPGETRGVVGFGSVQQVDFDAIRQTADLSWRSLGSTTLSILEILRSRMHCYFNKTKLWDFFWALGLSQIAKVDFRDLRTNQNINNAQLDLVRDPESTISLFCFRDARIAERVFPTIKKN